MVQAERFEVLKPTLTGDRVPHAELAVRLNMTVGAVHVAVHRMRQRYREALRAQIAATVDDPCANRRRDPRPVRSPRIVKKKRNVNVSFRRGCFCSRVKTPSNHSENFRWPAARTCPDCGAVFPDDALEGLCPACLLLAGLVSEQRANAGSTTEREPAVRNDDTERGQEATTWAAST